MNSSSVARGEANYLRIHDAVHVRGDRLDSLIREAVEDLPPGNFVGTNFCDVRRAAACELFELCYPEEYRVWEKSLCECLTFDPDGLLVSPIFTVEAVDLGEQVAVLVASYCPPRRQPLPNAAAVEPTGGTIGPDARRTGEAVPRNSVSAAWQHWRLGVEDRALIVDGVFCRAPDR